MALTKKEPLVGEEYGMVLYADGGSSKGDTAEVPAPSGWGLHGYVYAIDKGVKTPKKKYAPTHKGYATVEIPPRTLADEVMRATVMKANAKEEIAVKPILMIDGWGGTASGTNNWAELMALKKALECTKAWGIKRLHVKQDAMYVISGITKWVNDWIAAGWRTSSGKPVENMALWKEVKALRDELVDDGLCFTISHVDGHSGEPGNDAADYNAWRGKFLAMHRIDREYIEVYDSVGYDCTEKTSNRIIDQASWYGVSNMDASKLMVGDRHLYYFGNHGNDDKLVGKDISGATVEICLLRKPEPVLDALLEFRNKTWDDSAQMVVIGSLDKILNGKMYEELANYGYESLRADRHKPNIYSIRDDLILRERRPAYLSYNLLEMLNGHREILELYLNKDPLVVATDITDLVYTVHEKGNKKTWKPSNLMAPTEKTITVSGRYRTINKEGVASIRMKIGCDIPARNTLNALAPLKPKVTLLTWQESGSAIRYGTVVETGDDIGYWAAACSNLFKLV